jgi:hypothetical protein
LLQLLAPLQLPLMSLHLSDLLPAGQGAFGNMCRGGHMYAPTKVCSAGGPLPNNPASQPPFSFSR